MLADFPQGDENLIDERAESEMQAVIELITKVRNIRAEMNIKPSDKPAIHISADAEMQKIFSQNEAQILKLARVSEFEFVGNTRCSESIGSRRSRRKCRDCNSARRFD